MNLEEMNSGFLHLCNNIDDEAFKSYFQNDGVNSGDYFTDGSAWWKYIIPGDTGSTAGQPLQPGHVTPLQPNSSPNDLKFYTDNSEYFTIDGQQKVLDIIKKIIDGGKPQLILSLGSDDELEKKVAELLINLVAMWKKDNPDGRKVD